MTEKEYRIAKLRYNRQEFKNKRIALYGTGKNAEEILHSFPELNILALMDGKHTGEYLYGKKIISEEEARLLKIEVIIIAAEAGSAYVVSERIRDFCMNNNIALYNMYGYDEFKLCYNILNQEIRYTDCSTEELKSKINEHDVICFQLIDVLCAYKCFDKDSFLNMLEEKYFAKEKIECKDFQNSRKKAEEKVRCNMVYDIQDIYEVLRLITEMSEKECINMCDIEQQVLVHTMSPKNKLIDIANWSVEQGKDIYIMSEMHVSKRYVEQLLELIGINQYKGIIQENLLHLTMSKGALRIGLGENFKRNVLYIGTNEKYNLLLPQLYDMDIYLLKDAWSLMKQFPRLWGMNFTNNERLDDINELIQYTFDSPFIKDNSSLRLENDYSKKEKKELFGLFPLPEYENIEELDKLEFMPCSRPLVSIIVPAYNQFGYTYNCMRSILQNTQNIEYEVILADDCSTDDTQYIEQVVRGIQIVRNKENLLFLRNCNHAAQYARGKYILFLNNDTQVRFNWLLPLVQVLEKGEEVGLVGSKLLNLDGSIQDAGGIVWEDGSACNFGRGRESDDFECNYVREVDYVTGASMMIRADLWHEIGGFDKRYSPAYCEDSDLAFEVRKHNKKVLYQPMSEVVHFEGISNGKEINTGVKAYQRVNTYKLGRKWKTVLEEEKHIRDRHMLYVRDRKGSRKSVLYISNHIPRYDYDAYSRTAFDYLKLFIKNGYLVKFIAADFKTPEPYTKELQQMGIEVIAGVYCEENINRWILKNEGDIDFVFFHQLSCTYRFIRLLKCTAIKLRYYSHDLQFLQSRQQYEIMQDNKQKQLTTDFWKKEKYVLERVEYVYYPTKAEADTVKHIFKNQNVKQLASYVYDTIENPKEYRADGREGILFVGEFGEPSNVDAVLWFVREIYPLIYRVKPIPFYIAGSDAPIEIQQLDSAGIVYKGHLIDYELEEMYNTVKVVAAPFRHGAGMKVGVADALYQGVPVVSTSIGCEGILENSKCIVTADNSVEFAEKLLDLYANVRRLKELSLLGQNYIRTYCSQEVVWEKIKDDF
ncbi:MAG: glycosyltransferase [Lachnospiraceae bacterium]